MSSSTLFAELISSRWNSFDSRQFVETNSVWPWSLFIWSLLLFIRLWFPCLYFLLLKIWNCIYICMYVSVCVCVQKEPFHGWLGFSLSSIFLDDWSAHWAFVYTSQRLVGAAINLYRKSLNTEPLMDLIVLQDTDISPAQRDEAVRWLTELHGKLQLYPETLVLAVSILDRFLAPIKVKLVMDS